MRRWYPNSPPAHPIPSHSFLLANYQVPGNIHSLMEVINRGTICRARSNLFFNSSVLRQDRVKTIQKTSSIRSTSLNMIFLPRYKLASSQNVCYDRITEHDRVITRSASLTIGLPTTRLKLTRYDSWPTVKSKPELVFLKPELKVLHQSKGPAYSLHVYHI